MMVMEGIKMKRKLMFVTFRIPATFVCLVLAFPICVSASDVPYIAFSDVELWESQRSRGRYLVCELWESQEIYTQNSEKLWNEEKKDVFEKLNLYGMIGST